MLSDFEKGIVSVIVVRIDNGERFFDDVLAAKDRVPRAEGLGSARGQVFHVL